MAATPAITGSSPSRGREWVSAIYTSAQALLNRREIRGLPMPTIDTERFRLRNFVDKLVDLGECEVHNAPIDLLDVGGILDGNPRAVLFKAAGPEKAELVGNVMASRRRIAAALDTDERGLLGTLAARLNRLHPPVKVSSQQAPVQQVVLKDDDAED